MACAQVNVVGKDKRGLSVAVTCTMDGQVLGLQAIYGGKTEMSLPTAAA